MKHQVFFTFLPLLSFTYIEDVKSEEKQKNIVFIITDDQGYADLSCHGNPLINTPNIDALHDKSIRLNNYHTGTTSAPTRSSIMSGKYCNSVGVWHTVMGRSLLTQDVETLPQLLNEGGYTTGLFGKWHLGDNYPYRPQDRGFDQVLCHGAGGLGQNPDGWSNTGYDDTYLRNGEWEKVEGYCTDVWFSEAKKFIADNKENPFFCYISTNAPHGPFSVEKKYADPFMDNKDVPNPYFYGMIVNIDENVGKLMSFLKKEGLDENTIVIFTTDNGTTAGVVERNGVLIKGYGAGMRGKKSQPYEGGHRVPFFMHVPGREPQTINTLTGAIDLLPTLLEINNLKRSIPKKIDGVSLMPLIEGGSIKDRYLFADTQRQEHLEEGRLSCVMKDNWRLVNGNELYDLSTDLSQQTNIADKHPELVAEMQDAYNDWWDKTSVRADIEEPIIVGSKNAPKVILHGHDLHTGELASPFSQHQVRSGMKSEGYWRVDADRSKDYSFDLYRWPVVLNHPINAGVPEVKNTWGYRGDFKAGKALNNIVGAELLIDGELIESKEIDSNKPSVRFESKMKKGSHDVTANFLLADGSKMSCYYLKIK